MSWTNGSQDGYEKGLKDGEGGKPSNPVSSVKDVVNQSVRPESYTDTFVEKYKEGYVDGNRKRNDV